MGLTGTSKVDEELTQAFWPRAWSTWEHGWWLFLLSWCFTSYFTSPIPEPPCSLASEADSSPGSWGTHKPFPQLWGGHLSVTFPKPCSSTFFYFYLQFLLFRTLCPYCMLCPQTSVLLAKESFPQVPNGHSPTVSQNPQHSSLSFFSLLSSILFLFPVSSSRSPVSSCLLGVPV